MRFQFFSRIAFAFAGQIASVIVHFVYVDFTNIVVSLKCLYPPDYFQYSLSYTQSNRLLFYYEYLTIFVSFMYSTNLLL